MQFMPQEMTDRVGQRLEPCSAHRARPHDSVTGLQLPDVDCSPKSLGEQCREPFVDFRPFSPTHTHCHQIGADLLSIAAHLHVASAVTFEQLDELFTASCRSWPPENGAANLAVERSVVAGESGTGRPIGSEVWAPLHAPGKHVVDQPPSRVASVKRRHRGHQAPGACSSGG